MEAEKFPFRKLSHDLALKVTEKIPFGTQETQDYKISESKWYPFLSFELSSRFTAGLCSSRTKQTYFAVDTVATFEFNIMARLFSPTATIRSVKLGELKALNFSLHIDNFCVGNRSYDDYRLLFTELKQMGTRIGDMIFLHSEMTAEEICGIIEDFDVQSLNWTNVPNISFDSICSFPKVQQMKQLIVADSQLKITEEQFLGLSADLLHLASCPNNLTEKTLNKFLKEWLDGLRIISYITIAFAEGATIQERSAIFDGLHAIPIKSISSNDEFRLTNNDGDVLNIDLRSNVFCATRSCV